MAVTVAEAVNLLRKNYVDLSDAFENAPPLLQPEIAECMENINSVLDQIDRAAISGNTARLQTLAKEFPSCTTELEHIKKSIEEIKKAGVLIGAALNTATKLVPLLA